MNIYAQELPSATTQGWRQVSQFAKPLYRPQTVMIFLMVAGAGEEARFLDHCIQTFASSPISSCATGTDPVLATEKPSAALFMRLATEDPAQLIAWSRRLDLPRGLIARAAEALGQTADAGAIPALMALLESEDLVIKEGALNGLSRHPTPDVMARINAVVADDQTHPLIREIAAEVLADLNAG